MAKQEEKRVRWKNLRFKPDEYELLEGRFRKTRFRKLSEYMRSVLLEKPVTVHYRDKAMDEVLEELVLLWIKHMKMTLSGQIKKAPFAS